jgi:hypothetical protein
MRAMRFKSFGDPSVLEFAANVVGFPSQMEN